MTTVEVSVTQNVSNLEYLREELIALFWAVLTLAWDIAYERMTMWVLFYIGLACFIIAFVLRPFIIYLSNHMRALCKPVMFSYQHVVITGGGTGLGKTLVQGIFTKGAIVTMVGKDGDKLE